MQSVQGCSGFKGGRAKSQGVAADVATGYIASVMMKFQIFLRTRPVVVCSDLPGCISSSAISKHYHGISWCMSIATIPSRTMLADHGQCRIQDILLEFCAWSLQSLDHRLKAAIEA